MEIINNYIHNLSNTAFALIVAGITMFIFSAISAYRKWNEGDALACSYYEKTIIIGLVILIIGVLI